MNWWLYFLRLGLVAVAAVCVVACAEVVPKRPVQVPLTAPAKVAKADLTEVEAKAAKVAEANASAAGSVGRVSRELSALRVDLRGAVTEAERLRRQKSATEAELEENWRRLTAFEVSAGRAADEAGVAKAALAEQRSLGEALGTELLRARVAVEAKNREAEALRVTLGDTERLRAGAAAQAEELAAAAEKARGARDRLSGEVRIYRWVAVGVGAVLLLWVVVRFWKPI